MSRDGFLSRWSRRKAEAREAEREPDQAPPPPEEAPEDNLPAPAEDAPVAAEGDDDEPLDLPDIDSLTKESDYTVFLKDKVPAALRKQALRKLWRSDPVLANLDGLNDYDDDYSNPAVTGAAVRTAYNALRGYARAEPEEEQEAPQKAEDGVDVSEQDVHREAGQPEVDIASQQESGHVSSGDAPSGDIEYEESGKEKGDNA